MRYTQIVLRSRDSTELGLPNKLAIHQLGEPRLVGSSYHVPVLILREHNVTVPRLPLELEAGSAREAHELALRHYRETARQLKLEITIADLAEPGVP